MCLARSVDHVSIRDGDWCTGPESRQARNCEDGSQTTCGSASRDRRAGRHYVRHPDLNEGPVSADDSTRHLRRDRKHRGGRRRPDTGSEARRGLQRIETLAEKCQDHDLIGGELGVLPLELLRDLGFNHLHQIAGHVGVQDFRMHAAFAADGRRVAPIASKPFRSPRRRCASPRPGYRTS